jgi:hypothetical protein
MLEDGQAAAVPDGENINRFAFHSEHHAVNMRPAAVEEVSYLERKSLVLRC